jgi:hypothetical protein
MCDNAAMNKIDSLYYEAVTEASTGHFDIGTIRTLYEQASKFSQIDEPGEAARFYERILQILRTLSDGGHGTAFGAHQTFCTSLLREYKQLLVKLDRTERAAFVDQFVRSLA